MGNDLKTSAPRIVTGFDEDLWKAGVEDGAFSGTKGEGARWYVMDTGGIKVAIGSAVPGPGDLTTVSYYVAPTWRNQGYGTKLARYIADQHEKASFVMKKENEASVKVALAALRGKFAATMGRHVVRLTKEAAPLSGGLAEKEGKKPSDFDPKLVEEGRKVEMEHTDDPAMAKRIATDHLTEDKDYYKKLKKIEKKAADEKVALEFLKWAAGLKTYPISRFLTHPGGAAASGVATGALSGAAASLRYGWAPDPAVIGGGAGLGAIVGGLMGKLHRKEYAEYLQDMVRGFATRSLSKKERELIKSIEKMKLKKSAAPIIFPLVASPLVASVLVNQALVRRGLAGRVARGGVGMTSAERSLVTTIKRRALAKKILAGAGVAAAAGGAAYGTKKIVEAEATS